LEFNKWNIHCVETRAAMLRLPKRSQARLAIGEEERKTRISENPIIMPNEAKLTPAKFAAGLLSKMHGLFWETYLGVETRGQVPAVVAGGVHYSPLPFQAISRMLDRLELSPDDVLVDLGCGKGRVLCLACRRRLHQVIGIEINHDLIKTARRNIDCIRHKQSPVKIVELLAQNYEYDDATVIFMFNPFDEKTIEQVFAKLDDSYRKKPRKIKVAYAYCAYEQPLKNLGWLRRMEEWPPSYVMGFTKAISFWESDFEQRD
jgi:SAM-dependent methyltransferase